MDGKPLLEGHLIIRDDDDDDDDDSCEIPHLPVISHAFVIPVEYGTYLRCRLCYLMYLLVLKTTTPDTEMGQWGGLGLWSPIHFKLQEPCRLILVPREVMRQANRQSPRSELTCLLI